MGASELGLPILHSNASARALGLARVWVFGVWFLQLTLDPISRLAVLPQEGFIAPGPLAWLPDPWWPSLLSAAGLAGCKAITLVGVRQETTVRGHGPYRTVRKGVSR